MRIRTLSIAVVVVAVLFVGLWTGRGWLKTLGNTDSSAVPGSTSSYTMTDIYNRLNDGTAGTQSTFTEPTTAPGTGTGHTLDEVMGKAPAADNTDGATPAQVLTGKIYWSVRTDGSGGSNWGLEAGELHGGCTCEGTLVGTRWCDNGDGTVTDLTTCLVWLKKADWGGRRPWRTVGTEEDAHTRAGLLYAGISGADLGDGSVVGDWRLPTKTELYGLTHGTEAVRSGTPRAFTGVLWEHYWSSTTYAGSSSDAWHVHLNEGRVGFEPKNFSYYVWPIRGGQ